MFKFAGGVLLAAMILISVTAAAGEKVSGDFVVVGVAGNIVKVQNKATGARLPLEVTDKTQILHQGQHQRTLADIKKGAEFSGQYTIEGPKYMADKIDLK